MSSSLKQAFTADDKELVAAYERILRENAKLRSANQELTNDTRAAHQTGIRGARDHAASLGEITSALGGLTAGYVLFNMAMATVRHEWEAQIEMAMKARDSMSDLAKSRADLLQNAGIMSKDQRAEMDQAIHDAAFRGLAPTDALQRAYGQTIAATPMLTPQQRKQAFQVAAEFTPQEEMLPTIAAGLGDTSLLTGSADMLENLGVLADAAQQSRQEGPGSVAQYTIPAARNILGFGGTYQESLALPVTIGNAISDAEGRILATGAQQMAEQMHEFYDPAKIRERISKRLESEIGVVSGRDKFGERDQALDQFLERFMGARGRGGNIRGELDSLAGDKNLQQEFFKAYERYVTGAGDVVDAQGHKIGETPGVASPREMLERFWSHPELAAELSQTLHGEERPKGAMLRLLAGESQEATFFRRTVSGGFVAGEEAAERGRQYIETIRQDPMIQALQMKTAAENVELANRQADEQNQRWGEAREATRKMLESTGLTGYSADLGVFLSDFEAGRNPEEGRTAGANLAALVGKRARDVLDPNRKDFWGVTIPVGERERAWSRNLFEFEEQIDQRLHAARGTAGIMPALERAGVTGFEKSLGGIDLSNGLDQAERAHLQNLRRRIDVRRKELSHPGATVAEQEQLQQLDVGSRRLEQLAPAQTAGLEQKLDRLIALAEQRNAQAAALHGEQLASNSHGHAHAARTARQSAAAATAGLYRGRELA